MENGIRRHQASPQPDFWLRRISTSSSFQMSREGGFPKYQSERISLCPVALHTSGDEPGEFVSARAESGSACTLPNLRNAQILHQSQGA